MNDSALNSVEEQSSSREEELLEEMKDRFEGDQRRIEHTLRVLEYSKTLLEELESELDLNGSVVRGAAVLHDIGIPEAERKYGSSAPQYQQREGPPLAREILSGKGFSQEEIDHICRIVGNHHDPEGLDSPEFRVVYDADLLVNKEEGNRSDDRFLTDRAATLMEAADGD